MKKLHMLFIALVFILLSPFALAMTHETGNIDETESSIYITKDTKIKSKLIDQKLPKFKATIKASYPQIIGTKLSPAAQQFNQLMLTMVTNEMNQFKKYVKEDLAHMKTLPASVQNNYLDIDYDIDVIHPQKNT